MADITVHKLIIVGPDGKKHPFSIPIGVTTIGRQAGADLQLDNPQVSRRHARLVCTHTECEISDTGSSNGTYVNGEKLTPKAPVILAAGDILKIGPYQLTYSIEEVEIPEPEPDEPVATPGAGEPEIEGSGKPLPDTPETTDKPPDPPEKATADLSDKGDESPPAPVSELPPKRPRHDPAPPPPPDRPVPPPAPEEHSPGDRLPPGLEHRSLRLINFLPGIYHTDFLSRFLGMFEAILTPIEWNVDNFDLYLDPGTAPVSFLPWLANWFDLTTDPSWTEPQRRALLRDAHAIFARRGTRWALGRVLEIYTGKPAEIIDEGKDLEAHTFEVRIPLSKGEVNPELVEALIDAHKPAHTLYQVRYKR